MAQTTWIRRCEPIKTAYILKCDTQQPKERNVDENSSGGRRWRVGKRGGVREREREGEKVGIWQEVLRVFPYSSYISYVKPPLR